MLGRHPVDIICDCGSSVTELGEDEAGNLVAVGTLLCVTAPDRKTPHLVTEFQGVPLPVFRAQSVGRLLESEAILSIPSLGLISVPFPGRELLDVAYEAGESMLYLLGHDSLVRVDLRRTDVDVIANSLPMDGSHPLYECIRSRGSAVVAFRFGLRIWVDGKPTLSDDKISYDRVGFLSDRSVAAIVEGNGLTPTVRAYDIQGNVLNELCLPAGRLWQVIPFDEFTCLFCLQDGAVWGFPWIGGELGHGFKLFEGTPVGWTKVGGSSCAIATDRCEIYLYTPDRGRISQAMVADDMPAPVAKLFWSQSRRRLFIGHKDGSVTSAVG